MRQATNSKKKMVLRETPEKVQDPTDLDWWFCRVWRCAVVVNGKPAADHRLNIVFLNFLGVKPETERKLEETIIGI